MCHLNEKRIIWVELEDLFHFVLPGKPDNPYGPGGPGSPGGPGIALHGPGKGKELSYKQHHG